MVGVDADAVLLQIKGILAVLDVLQLVLVQVWPAPDPGVDDVGEAFAPCDLPEGSQLSVQQCGAGSQLSVQQCGAGRQLTVQQCVELEGSQLSVQQCGAGRQQVVKLQEWKARTNEGI